MPNQFGIQITVCNYDNWHIWQLQTCFYLSSAKNLPFTVNVGNWDVPITDSAEIETLKCPDLRYCMIYVQKWDSPTVQNREKLS